MNHFLQHFVKAFFFFFGKAVNTWCQKSTAKCSTGFLSSCFYKNVFEMKADMRAYMRIQTFIEFIVHTLFYNLFYLPCGPIFHSHIEFYQLSYRLSVVFSSSRSNMLSFHSLLSSLLYLQPEQQ